MFDTYQNLNSYGYGALGGARWNYCPHDGTKLELDWRYCPKCARAIQGHLVVCGNYKPSDWSTSITAGNLGPTIVSSSYVNLPKQDVLFNIHDTPPAQPTC